MKRTVMLSIFFLVFCSSIMSAANSMENNYPTPKTPESSAKFQIVSLKYEPYPVNNGDWFDLWVKVQNIGQVTAKNARFELKPEFPFSSTDNLTKEYGLIYGSMSAYTFEQKIDASQIILKYRIKVADNAPEGISILKLLAGTDGNQSATRVQAQIPIEIGKTKTNFDITPRDITDQGISFVVKNIGDNAAKAVDLSVNAQELVKYLPGNEPSSLGNLEPGDFTIANQKISTSGGSVNISVSYTDKAGIRSTFEKTVNLNSLLLTSVPIQQTTEPFPNWVYGSIGFLAGCFLMILIGILRRKK